MRAGTGTDWIGSDWLELPTLVAILIWALVKSDINWAKGITTDPASLSHWTPNSITRWRWLLSFNYPSENAGLIQPISENSYTFELYCSRPKYRNLSQSKMNSVALREPTPSSIHWLYNSWVKEKKSRLYIQHIYVHINGFLSCSSLLSLHP